ncbi:MAG: hypothetical protein ABJB33_04005 [Gemmatimonadota bacterium]
MPLLQFIGMLLLTGAVGVTLLSGIFWIRFRRPLWGWLVFGTPATYFLLLIIVTLLSGRETLAPGTPQRFCGFYIDCHLSVAVIKVERGPSEWTVTLHVGNDARRVALAPVGLRIELVRPDSTALLLTPGQATVESQIPAGEVREFTVSFAALPDGTTPTLRVTEGVGIDRIIEGALLGDDDALGRGRVRLGL